ncbi:AAA family ATPase [Deinococcus sonorensis]|uniref:AAA family ATPase n=1 Tax=Deinococcus sonorensis TaxID=309891 RepID=A0ABV8Y333_9DEIO
MGLPGGGKTTFYRNHFAGTHAHVSKDLFPNNRNKTRRQQYLLEEALSSGTSVVLDNTNPTVDDRAGAIALAHAFGAVVSGYVFPWMSRRPEHRTPSAWARPACRTSPSPPPPAASRRPSRRGLRGSLRRPPHPRRSLRRAFRPDEHRRL